jgi:hypothetical protein
MQFLIDLGLTFVYLCAFLLVLAWLWRFWKMYINQKYIDGFNRDCILLEIKLPREIFKSPLATEIALGSLLQSGGVNKWYARNFQGNLPQYSSLEIASLEGVIHFYIRAHKKFRNIIESNFYAQYPGIEIVEADDYTKKIRYHHLSKDVKTWSISFKLGKTWKPTNPVTGKKFSKTGKDEPKDDKDEYDMPADFLPIKTYVDYELDKDPKEEFKIDPITPLLEFMGSIGKGEYFWYQVLVQDESVYDGANKMPKFYLNKQTHDHLSLKEMADARKKQIRTSHYIKHGDIAYNDFGYAQTRMVPDGLDENNKPKKKEIEITYDLRDKKDEAKAVGKKEIDLIPEDKEELEIINKKISKPLALVVVRLVYVTKGQNFNGEQIQNILAFGKPYKGSNNFIFGRICEPYDFNWQKMGGKRVNWRSEEIFEEYVEREGFFPHIGPRPELDKMEDRLFYPYSMKTRKMFRMIYEAIFYPFEHPHPDQVSIMNLEEVATLWHLPGQVAGTPTLPRIDSVKGNAPANLPM